MCTASSVTHAIEFHSGVCILLHQPRACSGAANSPRWAYIPAPTSTSICQRALTLEALDVEGTPGWSGALICRHTGVYRQAVAWSQVILPSQCWGLSGAALVKVALDQGIMAPAGLALFYLTLSVLEGHGPSAALGTLQTKYAPTLAANYVLWPAANAINFAFVPNDQRILYINIVGVSGWGVAAGNVHARHHGVLEPNIECCTQC